MEYLLTDMPVSASITPVSTFAVLEGDRKHFPVENRLLESSLQDFNSFAHYMNQFRSAEFLQAISDIHVLVFMAQNEIMPLRSEKLIIPVLKSANKCSYYFQGCSGSAV